MRKQRTANSEQPSISVFRSLCSVRRRAQRGFTLIELLTVTAIIVIVTGVVLASNARFGGVVQLQNLAYDIALSVRQAQVYGISVSRFGAANFSAPYGIKFDSANASTYAIFADAVTQNGLYDCPSPGTSNCELVSAPVISSGYRISGLCATKNGVENCGTVARLDVVFRRPEPDAWISAQIGGTEDSCILNNAACQESGRIIVRSPRGDTMSVVIEANGQISVRRGTQ